MSVIETSIYVTLQGGEGIPHDTVLPARQDISIKFYPPQGIEIDHFRIRFNNPDIRAIDIKPTLLRGYFRQYDVNDNVLDEQYIELSGGTNTTVSLASPDVDHVELHIIFMQIENHGVDYTTENDKITTNEKGVGNELIRIATEDANNNETSALSVKIKGIIYTWREYTSVQVTGANPTREISIGASNTKDYIKKVWINHISITGTYDTNDKIKVELLDASGSVLANKEVDLPTFISNGYTELDFDPNTTTVRISLVTSKRIIETVRFDLGYTAT
ncbi:MAG: hypothetical protein DRO40_08650 [Thermoprotei archaeon]|nr:MAG: hypothetical protein DRO40_08650 [Thermoprotei archaeon]